MNYTVLARKYRPKTLDEIVGQRVISQTLKNSILSGRISNAYIFSGMRGVGKTTTARVFAKSLNCIKGPTANPCNECEFCISIQEGKAIDVIEIDGASNRGIDDVRELREIVKFPPMNARYKVIIIDEVHMLTTEAFNALLKTLEEPPSYVIFIMATTEFHKVPPTIVSRSQHFEFKRISEKEIYETLSKISENEGIKISPSSLRRIATTADGSLRDAEVLLDQIVSYSGIEVKDEDVDEILGITDSDTLFSISYAISEGKGNKIIEITDKLVENGKDLRRFLKDLTEHFRIIYLTKIFENPSEVFPLSGIDTKKYLEEAKKFEEEELFRYMNLLLHAEGVVRYSVYPRYIVETTLLKLSYLRRLVPLEKIINTLSEIPSIQRESKKEVSELAEVKEEKKEIFEKTEMPIKRSISADEFIETIKEDNPRLYATLKNLSSISIEGRTMKIILDKTTEHLKETIQKNQVYLENKFKEVTGEDILIVFESKIEKMGKKEEELPPLLKMFLHEMNGELISRKKIEKGEEDEEYV
ncbi:MAG: DNA polymerase III subunit gamma/tau [Candidatus Aminicenantia bacterium]